MSRAQELATAAATRTGRIALLSAPRRMDIVTAAVEEPGPGQVLVRLAGCGVCGSNLPVWEGREWFEYPQPSGAPGHEGWGVVEATGPSVTGVR
ncbi:MAG TPA: alcohol dehydrogenase catalytic domain-containing protein, partial [Longimicrobiales bacterium]|nr:alcohol dehydrogenase catalytic domain-containing protein [Longimicrobiales bacterium]